MKRDVSIGRLRIRVPAAKAAQPQRLAAAVARHLAQPGIDCDASRVGRARAEVTATGGADALARDVARAVRDSIRRGGED